MRKISYQPDTLVYIILIAMLLCTSCIGQPGNVHESGHDSAAVKQNQLTKQTYKDPLFYIDGQLCQHVRRIFQDTRGNLWFGTNVYGLMRYGVNPYDSHGGADTLLYFTEKDGLGGGRITGIVEDKDGNVWFGTYGGLARYKPQADGLGVSGSFTNFNEENGLVNPEIWSMIIDRKGIFWIGTMAGISRFDGEKFTPFPIPKAPVNDTTSILGYDRITSILEDRNGVFWFGTDGFGICIYDPSGNRPGGKTFTHITTGDGLCDNNITHILEDRKGNIWIGTMYGGISRYNPDRMSQGEPGKSFTNFTANGTISGAEVWSIYEDASGDIWFPAENSGVYRYHAGSGYEDEHPDAFTNFDAAHGLNTNGIQSIFRDKEGRFWFGGWGGLFRYDGKSFYSVTKTGPWH